MKPFDLHTRRDVSGLWVPVDVPEDGIVTVRRAVNGDGTLPEEWLGVEEECFVEDLVELAAASAEERAGLVGSFEVAVLRDGVGGCCEETAVSKLADGRYALYHASRGGPRSLRRVLDPREVSFLKLLMAKADVPRWRSHYRLCLCDDEWAIDDNRWSFELIADGVRLRSSGTSAAPDGLDRLARGLRDLVREDSRKRKRMLKRMGRVDE